MSTITIHYEPPAVFSLSGWQIGESSTEIGALAVVASGALVGSYPSWDNEFIYASGDTDYWYSIRFTTNEGDTTAYSSRFLGKYDSINGFLVYANDDTLYLVPPDTSGVVPNWLNYNTEYTVTVASSGMYGSGTTYMADDYTFFFTAEYCPLWSTVTDVRLAVGPIIDSIPDDTINRMIYRTSLTAIRKYFGNQNLTAVHTQLYLNLCLGG